MAAARALAILVQDQTGDWSLYCSDTTLGELAWAHRVMDWYVEDTVHGRRNSGEEV